MRLESTRPCACGCGTEIPLGESTRPNRFLNAGHAARGRVGHLIARRNPWHRLLAKLDYGGPGCWTWTGKTERGGYGRFSVRYQREQAHRWVWEQIHGPIPDGLQIHHHCDVRTCVRPSHLFIGTQLDNMRDRNAKGRANVAIGERLPHAKLTAALVADARRLYVPHDPLYGAGALARRYGVNHATMSAALHGTNWKHVS